MHIKIGGANNWSGMSLDENAELYTWELAHPLLIFMEVIVKVPIFTQIVSSPLMRKPKTQMAFSNYTSRLMGS